MKNLAKNWKTLFTVCLIIGLVANANAEDFNLEIEPIIYLYRIEINSKPIWELPLSQVETVTKEEWKDIDVLINLVGKTYYGIVLNQLYAEISIRAMVNTLAPKRFIVKGN